MGYGNEFFRGRQEAFLDYSSMQETEDARRLWSRLRPTLECRRPRIGRNSPHASAEPVDFGAIVSLKKKVMKGIVR